MGLTDAEVQQLQDAIDAGDQLAFEKLLADFINAGKITQAEAQEVNQYAMPTSTINTTAQFGQPFTPADVARVNASGLDPDIILALESVYTSNTDLADRLGLLVEQGHITESSASKYYNTILGIKPTSTLFGETNQADIDRKAQMYIRAGRARVQKANLKTQPTPEEVAVSKAGTIMKPGTEFEKAYAGTPEYAQKKAERQMAMETIYGKRPDMQDRQAQIDAEQVRLNARDKQRSEGQTADALIAMLNRREPVAGVAPIPKMPSELSAVQPALNAANYGEGTKLRSFIESKIAETAQSLRPARLAWWQRRNAPPEPEEPTYEDVVDRMTGEANRWKTVAENAPTSEVAGNTAYGVGGLKAIAEKAYSEAQGRLSRLNPADFPQRGGFKEPQGLEEDPLTKALSGRRWWEEYARLPGAGTVPRLQRAVRFR